jgi:hypothetical protein
MRKSAVRLVLTGSADEKMEHVPESHLVADPFGDGAGNRRNETIPDPPNGQLCLSRAPLPREKMNSENQVPDSGIVTWALTMDVKVKGVDLPFRLRIVTDDEETMLDSLSDFQSMIFDKIRKME